MRLRQLVLLSSFSLALAGQGCSKPTARGPRLPEGQEPPWLLVRVDAVNVTPYHPGTTRSWDGPAPAPNGGADCGLLGLSLGFINPILGKGANYLCQMGHRSLQLKQDPSAPDLAILVSVGTGATCMTYTARDTVYDVFRREFIMPIDLMPAEGTL